MAVKQGKDLGVTWGCTCGVWNFAEAKLCWKCHQPKYPNTPKKRAGRPRKEAANTI